MVSITVLIITYNQQDVIGRALDSVLCQTEWGLKEIVICDDNSSDNNWEIIQSYVNKYPNIIRAYRNEQNLGIYGNVERTYALRGDADFYVNLSGDDSFCHDYFRSAQEFIKKEKISPQKEAVSICFDYAVISPNGGRITISNKYNEGQSAFRMKFRGLLSTRGLLMSTIVMNRYSKVPLDMGIPLAENSCEIQGFKNADKVYYVPFVASYYYSQIGFSTKMKSVKTYKDKIIAWNYYLQIYDLCPRDKRYSIMMRIVNEYMISPSIQKFFTIIFYMIASKDFSLGRIISLENVMTLRDIIKRPFINVL